jgi:hypothetical protein
MPTGEPWPRVSIVTPSFNHAAYLEETIRSVLLQGYPALDYVVMDGGSSDGSVAILERYAPWLTHWQSAPDGGQADAINAGLAYCRGEIFNFINSDDVLMPGALAHVAACFQGAMAVAGGVINHGLGRDELFIHGDMSLLAILREDRFHQPGLWFSRASVSELSGFDPSYDYCFDKKFLLGFASRYDGQIAVTEVPLVMFRFHDRSKTMTSGNGFRRETLRLLDEITPSMPTAAARREARRQCRRLRRRLDRDRFLSEAAAAMATQDTGRWRVAGMLLWRALAWPRARLHGRFWTILRKGLTERDG